MSRKSNLAASMLYKISSEKSCTHHLMKSSLSLFSTLAEVPNHYHKKLHFVVNPSLNDANFRFCFDTLLCESCRILISVGNVIIIILEIDVVLVEVLPPVRRSASEFILGEGTGTLVDLFISLKLEWQTLPLLLVIVLKLELCSWWQVIELFDGVAFGFPLLSIFEFLLKLAKLVDNTVVVLMIIAAIIGIMKTLRIISDNERRR
uniref:Uncharacterized protein n=1 Tax=Glossina pallidipes TaxID=7398 RepID=A0A1B0ACC4_GLOPL